MSDWVQVASGATRLPACDDCKEARTACPLPLFVIDTARFEPAPPPIAGTCSVSLFAFSGSSLPFAPSTVPSMDYPEVPRFVSPDPVPDPHASPASPASSAARTDDYDSEIPRHPSPTPTARTHAVSHSPTTLANDDAYAGDHDGQTDGHDAYPGDEDEDDGDAYERDDDAEDGTSYNNGDTTGDTNRDHGTPHDSGDDVPAWGPQSNWDPIFAELWREMEGESFSHVLSEPV